GRGGGGLGAQPHDGRERHQRHRELGVEPLDLEVTLRVRVDVERGLVTAAHRAALNGGACRTAHATGPVVAVDEARLTPHGVDFESEHCFCWPDLADDVEPATGTGVPLGVTLTAYVEVVQAHVAGE